MKNIIIERDSLSDIIFELIDLVDEVEHTIMQAADAYCKEGIRNVQQSYLMSVERAQVGDFIYSSIGYRITPSTNDNTIAWAGVGVYKIPTVESQFGKTSHDFTAAQLAYWLEFGTTRFNSGARKPKKASWQDASTYVEKAYSTVPKPFVSNAMVNGDVSRDNAFVERFNQILG